MRPTPLLLGFAALVVLVLPAAAMAATSEGARLVSWRLVATAPDDSGGWLCDDTLDGCDPARLRDRAARGQHCAWIAEIETRAVRGQPLVLRDVAASVYAHVERGDLADLGGGVRNTSGAAATFDLPWRHGAWWRGEVVEDTVALGVPCDARRASVSMNLQARSTRGAAWSQAFGTEVVLVPAWEKS